jgi:hypothetical protein
VSLGLAGEPIDEDAVNEPSHDGREHDEPNA